MTDNKTASDVPSFLVGVSTESLPPEFQKILNDNLWELYSRSATPPAAVPAALRVPDEKEPIINPCKCGGAGLLGGFYRQDGAHMQYVECEKCGHKGPTEFGAYDNSTAIDSWNATLATSPASTVNAAEPSTTHAGEAPGWEGLAAYMVDHCEGETVSEELILRWAAAMLKLPQYAAPTPSAPEQEQAAVTRALPEPVALGALSEKIPPEGWCSLERNECAQLIWDGANSAWAKLWKSDGSPSESNSEQSIARVHGLRDAYRIIADMGRKYSCYGDGYKYKAVTTPIPQPADQREGAQGAQPSDQGVAS